MRANYVKKERLRRRVPRRDLDAHGVALVRRRASEVGPELLDEALEVAADGVERLARRGLVAAAQRLDVLAERDHRRPLARRRRPPLLLLLGHHVAAELGQLVRQFQQRRVRLALPRRQELPLRGRDLRQPVGQRAQLRADDLPVALGGVAADLVHVVAHGLLEQLRGVGRVALRGFQLVQLGLHDLEARAPVRRVRRRHGLLELLREMAYAKNGFPTSTRRFATPRARRAPVGSPASRASAPPLAGRAAATPRASPRWTAGGRAIPRAPPRRPGRRPRPRPGGRRGTSPAGLSRRRRRRPRCRRRRPSAPSARPGPP